MPRPSRRILLCLGLLSWLSCEVEPPIQPATNRAPTARIGGAQASQEGSFIAFDASGSTDPDGDTLTYAWDFGDGQKRAGWLAPHAFRDEGSYQVSLIVTDSRGAGDTAYATISVVNAPPVITGLVVPAKPVIIGTPATIEVAFSDPGTADSLVASVDWGDQTSSLIANGSASHTYAAVGNYVVTATVRDNDGAVTQRTASSAIVIAIAPPNRPPVAKISGASTGREGASVSFSARGSTDPEDGDSVRYTWLPGDGRKFHVNEPIGWYIEQGWGYPDNGIFTVSVIVTDRLGAADTASMTVTVLNTPPVVGVYPPVQQAVGDIASSRFAVSDAGSLDKHTIAISWGDGTRDSIASGSEPWNNVVMHTYAQPGSYRVEATARDEDGGVASATATYPVIVFDATAHKSVAGYDVFDLGTLGGNSTRPSDFNDFGQIVGSSLTASGATHAFIWENGTLRDLGTLGYLNSDARRISNAGMIAGAVWSRPGEEQYEVAIPAIWRNGVGTIITDESFNRPATAVDINESGDIVWAEHGHEDPYAWVWNGGSWQRMSLAHAYSSRMNERTQIVGSSAAVMTPESAWPTYHPFLWEKGAMRDLGLLAFKPCRSDPNVDCGYGGASSINETGQIVGWSTAADGSHHVVLWENNSIRDLWTIPAGGYETRTVINDAGLIAASAGGEAIFWDGMVHSLGSLGGGGTEIADMNEAGIVVGTSKTASGEQHAFVWTQTRGMVDLGTGPHGFNWTRIVGISFRGDIVGFATQVNPGLGVYPMQTRAILWRNTSGNP